MSLGMPVLGSISGEAYSIIKKSNCGLVGHASDETQLFKNILIFLTMNNNKFKIMSKTPMEKNTLIIILIKIKF